MSNENSEPRIVRGTWPSGVVEMDDGRIFVKVVSFPVTDESGFAGESMWVVLKDGTEMEGTGHLDNEPMHSDIQCGSLIRFEGGTPELKPRFVEVISGPDEE
jgi:hypothetical protein